MQRLRTTFKRSRTPTGAEMKTQSSLEVPKQVRSASFDEIQLEAKRAQQAQMMSNQEGGFLAVPAHASHVGQRSRSFDSAATSSGGSDESSSFLEVPNKKYQRRRSSGDKSGLVTCVHCVCLEEYNRTQRMMSSNIGGRTDNDYGKLRDSYSYSSGDTDTSSTSTSSDEEDNDEVYIEEPHHNYVEPRIDVIDDDDDEDDNVYHPRPIYRRQPPLIAHQTQVPIPDFPGALCITVTLSPDESLPLPFPPLDPPRRRSITSPKLERQEAFSFGEMSSTVSEAPGDHPRPPGDPPPPAVVVSEFFLAVPELKRDRAASVDSCFIQKSNAPRAEEIDEKVLLQPPPAGVSTRSRSVDIVLPTEQQARYKALAMTPAHDSGKAVGGESGGGGGVGGAERAVRATPDWSETALNGDHLWSPTSASGDFCYVGENECTKHGQRMKCSACKIVAHLGCITILMDRVKFTCKPTFRDVGVRLYREQTCIHHHWVHRRSQKGKCKQCGKSFQSKLSFSSKEIVALSCSWCKIAFHNKESCFNLQKIGEECNLGYHSSIVVPPSWIVKLPRKGSFKSSLRKSPKKKPSSKKRSKEKTEKEQKTFVMKPIPTANVHPVIVFINPKSGGNQGTKLLQKFQWLLNPRQVFDLTQGGPKMGLELFRKVPNLRVLACGGDGTVGWVLSVLDQLNVQPPPAVGVLPLGTGNDLARALGWGGGYTDEPISKILSNIGESEVVKLDRWSLKVEKNPDAEANEEGKENLPLNVVNNYFSLGVDAHIALEFHEAREAHPERFNSRLRNKMFYGQMGGKDLLRRKWKGLAELVTLECDGKDMTPKLKEHKVHAIVFLNIPSYGGGTHPWNRASGVEQSTEDGLIEVVGLTTYQLPLLQAGGHGTSICQCQTAKIVTTKTIPMQVDGEACKLTPSIINMNLLNKAPMLAKRRGGKANIPQATLEQLKVTVQRINMADYEQHHYDKELLKQAAITMGSIEVNPVSDLEQVRQMVIKLQESKTDQPKLSPDWCFVDSCTAERFFRVDRAQEHLHYLTDIANEMLYVLDTVTAQTPDDDPPVNVAFPATNSNHQSPSSLMGDQTTPELSPSDDMPRSFGKSKSQDSFASMTTDDESSSERRKYFGAPASRQDLNLALLSPDDQSDAGDFMRLRQSPLVSDNPYISNLLEKTSDGIIKAARSGDLKMLKDLHEQGFSLLSIDASGQTALHYGARYGHKDIVRYLVASAPTSILNMADNDKGQTALHKAAAARRRSICCMLVAGGACLNMEDNQGKTPRLLAKQAEDHELADYLESQENFQLVTDNLETVV